MEVKKEEERKVEVKEKAVEEVPPKPLEADWTCAICTFMNTGDSIRWKMVFRCNNRCNACDTFKPGHEPKKASKQEKKVAIKEEKKLVKYFAFKIEGN